MECGICFNKYGFETEQERPCSIVPCGHTICAQCFSALPLRNCPFCKIAIAGKSVNWSLMEVIQSHANDGASPPTRSSNRRTNIPSYQNYHFESDFVEYEEPIDLHTNALANRLKSFVSKILSTLSFCYNCVLIRYCFYFILFMILLPLIINLVLYTIVSFSIIALIANVIFRQILVPVRSNYFVHNGLLDICRRIFF